MQMNKGLFREQAIRHQSAKLDGEVTIAQPLRTNVLLTSLLLVVVAVCVFLFTADFNRKATVQGYLKPKAGLAKVISPRHAVIKEILVENGQQVSKGDPLAVLQSSTVLADGNNLSTILSESLSAQISALRQRKAEYFSQQSIQHSSLEEQLSIHHKEATENDALARILSSRLDIQNAQLDQMLTLSSEGAVSRRELQAQQDSVLAVKQQLSGVFTQQQQLNLRISQIENQFAQLPSETARQEARFDAEETSLLQQKTEVNANNQILITAPVAGRVTNFAQSAGENVSAQAVLLAILPEGTPLQAVLLVPTRAFGFVQDGQQTRIRFDAFPYQRFGLFAGQISQAARHIVLPGEMSLPVNIQEPVYPVEVTLSQQTVQAYGNTMHLQSGMLLSADIVLEQRSLMSWLLEPLMSLKGTL